MDATYKGDLRDMNEQNFARFEARLEQRLAELRAEMLVGFARLETGLKVSFEQALREQTRWFVAAWGALVVAWATLLALNIAMWARLP